MMPNPQTSLPNRIWLSFPREVPMMIHPIDVIKLNKEMHFVRPKRFAKIPQRTAPNIWEKLMMLAAKVGIKVVKGLPGKCF